MSAAATAVWGRAEQQDFRARVRGALLGGAIGDALGAGVAALTLEEIRAAHGPDGLADLVPAHGRRGAVTAVTQLTLFTVDGLIRAQVRRDTGAWHPPTDVHRAYLRWAATQRDWGPDERRKDNGWLAREEWLYTRRDPARSTLVGLGDESMGTLDGAQEPRGPGCRGARAVRAVRAAGGLGAAAGVPARRGVRGADARAPHRVSRRRARSRSSCTGWPAARPWTAPCSGRSRCSPRAPGTSPSRTRSSTRSAPYARAYRAGPAHRVTRRGAQRRGRPGHRRLLRARRRGHPARAASRGQPRRPVGDRRASDGGTARGAARRDGAAARVARRSWRAGPRSWSWRTTSRWR